MGIPFVFNLEWITDYLTVFRQFRSLGRFDWLFYFVASVFAVVVLNDWYNRLRLTNAKTAIAFLVLLAGLWSSDAVSYAALIRSIGATAKRNYDGAIASNGPDWAKFLSTFNYKPSDFQAMLSLPSLNVGSEKYWVGDRDPWGFSVMLTAALRLHLPVMDANLSRSGWGNCRKQLKLVSGPFADKQVLNDLGSDKPILVLTLASDTLSEEERYLLRCSDSIGTVSGCKLWALFPKKLKINDRIWKDSVLNIARTMRSGDTCIGDGSNLFVSHFEQSLCAQSLFGKGAIPKKADSILCQIPITSTGGGQYEFSVWFLVDSTTWANPEPHLYFLDRNGRVLKYLPVKTLACTDHEHLWSRADAIFYLPKGTVQILVSLLKQTDRDFLVYDEIVFKPGNSLVISKLGDGKIMANNHWLK